MSIKEDLYTLIDTNVPDNVQRAITAEKMREVLDQIVEDMAITELPSALTTNKGSWNANTNTPTLSDGSGTAGDYYIVSVAGSTSLDGISTWAVDDYCWFDGNTNTWQRIENGVVATPGGISGCVQFAKDGAFEGVSQLFWDYLNYRLGIGFPSTLSQIPQQDLHLYDGNIRIGGLLSKKVIGTNSDGDLIDAAMSLYFDATVGTGGDYAEPQDAFDEGYYRLKAVGDVTLTQINYVDATCILDLNGYNIDFGDYYIQKTSGNLFVYNGSIEFASTTQKSIFDSFEYTELKCDRVDFTNNSTNQARVANGGIFTNCTLEVNASTNTCGWGENPNRFNGLLSNITINGNNASSQYVIWGDDESEIHNIRVTGTWGSVLMRVGKINGLVYDSTDNVAILANYVQNMYEVNTGKITLSGGRLVSHIRIQGISGQTQYTRFTNCIIDDSNISSLSSANVALEFSNCKFPNGFELTSSNSYRVFATFTGCRFENDLIFTKHQNNCKVIGCTIVGDLTVEDDGTNLTVIGTTLSGTLTNKGDYNTFRDCDADTIDNQVTAGYAVFDNCTYLSATGSATDSSTTTRKWDIYAN